MSAAASSITLVEETFGGSDLSSLSGDEPVLISEKVGVTPKIGQAGKGDHVYCHHCHRACNPSNVSRCTNDRPQGKSVRVCNRVFCHKDLTNRYGYTNEKEAKAKTKGKEWTCPCCHGECMEAGCRKKRDAEPITSNSDTTKTATPKKTSTGSTKQTPLDRFLASANLPAKRDSSAFELDASDPGVPVPKPKKARASTASTLVNGTPAKAKTTKAKEATSKGTSTPKPKTKPKAEKDAAKAKSTPTKATATPSKKKVAKTPEGGPASAKKASALSASGTKAKVASTKGKADAKVKGKANGRVTTPSKVKPTAKARPKPKPKPAVPRPDFELVDTALGKEDVENRIHLREYLFRFREVLSIPERMLFAIDDFDRPLTEASVRLFAGSMLDVFKDEFHEDELHDILFRHREEIRYYADLARISSIFQSLCGPLDLQQLETSNTGDALRRGASKVPTAEEVVRILVSMAERTLQSPLIHDDLDAPTGEAEDRRENAKAVKEEKARWEAEKKILNAGTFKAKSGAEAKQNAEALRQGQKDHTLNLTALEVNLRAALGRRSYRYSPLGQDHEGRTYYSLSAREVDDKGGRPPVGWALGMVCWGKGGADTESLPAASERWSHFGTSDKVKQLVAWLEDSKPKTSTKPAKVAEGERHAAFVEGVKHVGEWLEVLESKGMGEV